MAEGVFLHSNVETVSGRACTNGGFRPSPRTKKLTRHAQFSIPNPWVLRLTGMDRISFCTRPVQVSLG